MTELIKIRSDYFGNNFDLVSPTELVKRIERGAPSYEVIVSNSVPKLYLDFDLPVEKDMFDHGVALSVETILTNAINKQLNLVYPDLEPNLCIATCHTENYSETQSKYSIRYFISNIKANQEAQLQFAKCINDYILKNTDITDYVELENKKEVFDLSVYSPSRKMRCLTTSKPNENRPFILKQGTIENSIIQAFYDENCEELVLTAPPQTTTSSSPVVINGNNEVEIYVKLGIKYGIFEQITGHKKWISLGFIIKNALGDNGEDLFVDLSRHDQKFVEDDVRQCYKQLNKTIPADTKKPVTIKTLMLYYKDADMELTKQIIKEANKIMNPKKENDMTFESIAVEFEKTHAKIINKGVFVKQLDNDNILMSRQHIKSSYENMVYQKYDKNDALKTCNFINDWLVNNPNQRCYDDIGVYPKDCLCPDNIFNMWRKFAMELVTDYQPRNDALEKILNHIKILCNNEEEIYEYFVKWIAQMIQYPEVKSICPVLISKEGAGKGTLLRLFEKMLGNDKIFQTTTPSRDIWGEFNSHMANSFLVNLDELSKKETLESEGKIKGLITEPKLTINNKGVNKYDIQSYHRFIITTNNEEPVNTSKDDRRKMIVRSSDEKIGDKEYFEELYELLDDINVVKTCFEYFKSIPDMHEFHKLKMPCTEYQTELKEMGRTPIEKWLEDFTWSNIKETEVKKTKEEVLDSFNDWKSSNGVEYNVDSLKFMVRLNRMNIKGVEKHHTKKGNVTKFTIEDLKKHFGIGCMI